MKDLNHGACFFAGSKVLVKHSFVQIQIIMTIKCIDQHLSMFPSGHVIKDLEQVVTVGRQLRIKQAIIIPRRMFTK